MSSRWPIVPVANILTEYREYIDSPEARLYPKLSVKLYGRGVTLDAPADGATLRMKRHQIAKCGQVILSEIWGKKGAIGIVPKQGDGALCTSHFFLFDVNTERVHPGWLQAIFRANYLEPQLNVQAFGTTGYAAVRPQNLLVARIPLPPLPEQRRIVARIEELAAKIEEALRLRKEVESSLRAVSLGAYREITKGARRLPMAEVSPLMRRPVDVEPSVKYHELGIRSFGKGTFHKPPIEGASVGTKKLFRIEPNDLLFHVVFAWEGAVAVAKPRDHDRVGSHRFLACVPKEGLATSTFLCFHFLTDEGLEQLGKASPGGAGRNRTLGLKALEGIRVPVPVYEKQLWFDSLLVKVDSLRALHTQTAAELDALLASILDKAFKGEL